jgi:hypothetical protein
MEVNAPTRSFNTVNIYNTTNYTYTDKQSQISFAADTSFIERDERVCVERVFTVYTSTT